MTYAMIALAAVGLLEAVATLWLVRGLRRLGRVDERLGHLTEALRLLAETTEAGFMASADEIARAARPAAAPRETATAARSRVKRPATVRKERAVKPETLAVEMSEGELRLRRHLAETGVARVATAAKEAGRGALRA
jgi:hypothetical protein